MTISSDEGTTADDLIHEALINFTACIGAALPDICSYGLTIGDSYVPFDPDEGECEEEGDEGPDCSQVWVRVMGVAPAPASGEPGFGGECSLILAMQLEVGVLRCFGIEEEGEAPTASDTLAAAIQAMSDMTALHRAAMSCEVWDSIETGTWQPSGPLGGQYGGIWDFTVELPGGCLMPPESV